MDTKEQKQIETILESRFASFEKEIERIIDKKVNGKIEDMNTKLDAHLELMKPFLDGWKASKVVTRAIKWTAGFVIAVATAILLVAQLIKRF